MKKVHTFFLVVGALLFFFPAVYAETIILKSGAKLQESIVRVDDRSFQAEFHGVRLTHFWEDVESIDGQSVETFRSNWNVSIGKRPIPSSTEPIIENQPAVERSTPGSPSAAYSEEEHNAEWYIGLGKIAARKGEYPLAIKEYSRAIKLKSGETVSPELYFLRAAAYEMDNQIQNACNDYLQIGLVYGGFARLFFTRLNAQGFRPGALAKALQDADEEIASSGRSADVLKKRGFALLLKSDFDAAIKDYQEALDLQKEDNSLRAEYAFALLLKGDFQGCIKESNAVLAKDPNLAVAYVNRGNARSFLGDYAEALEDFSRAISLDPGSGWAYSDRAYLLDFVDGGKESPRAMEAIEEALKRNPGNFFLLIRRLQRYKDAGDLANAMQDCDRAIALNPDYFLAYSYKGNIYARQADWKKALDAYNKSLELFPEDGETYAARAFVYFQTKEYQKSLSDIDKAFEFGSRIEPGLLSKVKKAMKQR